MRAARDKLKMRVSSTGLAQLLFLFNSCPPCRLYNLDTQSPLVFKGLNGTLFGYSVLLHSFGTSRWLIAGAPKASWPSNSSVVNPGAIFRCQIGNNPKKDCEILQVGEWKWKFDLTLLVVRSSKQQSSLEKKNKEIILSGSDLISFIRKNVAKRSI